jgi:RNA polymerase sigma factor (sigma-70 family)
MGAAYESSASDHADVGISRSFRVSTNEGQHTSAWERLHRVCFRETVRLIARMVDDSSAEDLAQDAFLALREPMLKGCLRNPAAYLRTVAKNKARNWLRDRPEDLSLEGLDEKIPDPRMRSAEAEMCAVTRADAYVGALRQLTAGQRQAYALVDLRGFTESEAARILGKTRSTVSTFRSRALIALKSNYLLADSC